MYFSQRAQNIQRAQVGMQILGYRWRVQLPLQEEPVARLEVGHTLSTRKERVRNLRWRSFWPSSGRREWWRRCGNILRTNLSGSMDWKRHRLSHGPDACHRLTD